MRTRRKPAILALADGTVFHGESIGSEGSASGEVVFNTSMTGYQEILTDPSYCQQIVTLTYPHIGNVGTNRADAESERIFASALVIRDYPRLVSSWRSRQPLDEYLNERKILAIAGIDTRQLTRLLRDQGAQSGCVSAGEHIDEQAAIAQARAFPGLKGMDLAKVVSTAQVYEWNEGVWQWHNDDFQPAPAPVHHVVAYDFGIKRNILRLLAERRCRLTVVPAQTPAAEVLQLKPDGVFLSNGPGDPQPCDYAIGAIRELLLGEIPIFGICLGHQLLGLACGAKTIKMKFGHHGGNHPVQELASRRVFITSQNHGFAVDDSGLPDCLQITHRSLFDGTLQGLQHTEKPAFGFQGHPEASPGPHDINSLFDRFVAQMQALPLSQASRV